MKGNVFVSITLIAQDDIDNQSAAKIAKECDPEGLRTIGRLSRFTILTLGVLTKADTLQEGEYDPWVKILNNQSHVLRRGYYMTRLPGPTPKEMAQTWEESREIERRFFKKQPWSQQPDKSRFGIDKLKEALSSGLAKMIEEKFSSWLFQTDVNM